MMDSPPPVIFLSGAGGGVPNLEVFREGVDDTTRFAVIDYPGWKGYVTDGFSVEVLIEDLADQILTKVPSGPIRIIGLSLGGHLGYAIGIHLQAMGREIAGLCAIDSFMIASSDPSKGWQGRALGHGLELIRKRRIGEFLRLLRSRLWRLLIRLAGGRLPALARRFASSSRLPLVSTFDPILEEELSVRLLIREIAPWLASLDQEPVALKAPAILLRTRSTASDDAAWRRRCSNVEIKEISGQHHTLFEEENMGSLRQTFIAATRGWRGVR